MSIIRDIGHLLCDLAVDLKIPILREYSFPYPHRSINIDSLPKDFIGIIEYPENYVFLKQTWHGFEYTLSFNYKGKSGSVELCDDSDNRVKLYFESDVSNQWWVEWNQTHGAILYILFESFLKKLSIPDKFMNKYLSNIKKLIRAYEYPLDEDTLKKARRNIIEHIIKHEFEIRDTYCIENSSESRITFRKFNAWRWQRGFNI